MWASYFLETACLFYQAEVISLYGFVPNPSSKSLVQHCDLYLILYNTATATFIDSHFEINYFSGIEPQQEHLCVVLLGSTIITSALQAASCLILYQVESSIDCARLWFLTILYIESFSNTIFPNLLAKLVVIF